MVSGRSVVHKAVVLCAGEGSRLRPLTAFRPKHLLPVAGKPMLGWALETISAASVTDVGLVVGHHAEAIRQYVGTGDPWGLQVVYISQQPRLGLAHAVSRARDYVRDDPFLVYLGDNMLEQGIARFMEDLKRNDWDAAILLKSVHDPQRFGVAEVEGDRVRRVWEKPADPPSDMAIVGVYAFRPSVFDAIASVPPSERGEVELTDAIQWLIASGLRVRYTRLEGLWEDAGEPAAMIRTNQEWLERSALQVAPDSLEACAVEGQVGVEPGTRILRSRLVGPCRIGRNCRIDNCVLGPNVCVESGCEVSNARIRHSIIQRNCRICDIPGVLEYSLLGEDVELSGPAGGTDAVVHRLSLGDSSRVRLL